MANVEIDGVNSIVYTDKLDPKTGTALEIGTSGDTITIPSGATITNSGTANGFGGGKVLQFKWVQIAATQTRATTGYVDIASYTHTITPSATTSKIFIWAVIPVQIGAANRGFGIKMLRDTTSIFTDTSTDYGVYTNSSSADVRTEGSYVYLDAPSSTSSIVYKLQGQSYGGASITWNEAKQGEFIVMEIGA